MSDDYYMQWLGIGPGARPPDHYVLLSLPRFVASIRAMEAAAAAQLAKLDPYSLQPDRDKAAIATDIMNEVAAARATLTDAKQRAVYDLELAGRLGLEMPSADTADMADTVGGEVALTAQPLDLADLAAVDEDGPAPPVTGQVSSDDPDTVPATLFTGRVPLQESDPTFVPPHTRRAALPLSLALLFAGLGIALAVAAIVILLVVFAGDAPVAPSVSITTPNDNSSTPLRPPPRPNVDFLDRFDQPALSAAYEIRSGSAPHVGVRNRALVLGSATKGDVRVDVVPREEDVLFRSARVEVTIEPGTHFSIGIASAAQLSVTRSARGLEVRAAPGRASTDWPILPDTGAIVVQLRRADGVVVWRVNGRNVGTSPDIKPRNRPALTLTSAGPVGSRVAIDTLQITFDH